jgi:hypothetical protein
VDERSFRASPAGRLEQIQRATGIDVKAVDLPRLTTKKNATTSLPMRPLEPVASNFFTAFLIYKC